MDPGLQHTGWGVIDIEGNRLRHVANGVISPPVKEPMAIRLMTIFNGVCAILADHQPD
ncbi:MAG: crossover junction endodeoxyribonuclease RuvC, partial [Rhodospirillaceae bacterium]|nr:crossover junction endodeoxyribonuclease RuvC [Rhodospirillaceae bacterium]